MKNNHRKRNTICILTFLIFSMILLFVYRKGNDFSLKDDKINVQIEYGNDITNYTSYFSSQHVVCEDVMPVDTVGMYEVSCKKDTVPLFHKTMKMSVYDTNPPVVSLYETHVIADMDHYDRSLNIHEAYDIIDGNIMNVLYVNEKDTAAIEEAITTNYNKLHQRQFQFEQHKYIQVSAISIDDTYRNSIIISEKVMDDENHEVHILCVDQNYNITKTSYTLSHSI